MMALKTGSAISDSHGRSLFGGHSLRTGGAVLLASIGLDISITECLARWNSPMLVHYAKQAPLKNLTNEYKKRVSSGVSELPDEPESDVTENVLSFTPGGDIYISNPLSGIWHKSIVHEVATRAGKCFCGWAYSPKSSNCQSHAPSPEAAHKYCERCFPFLALKYNKQRRMGVSGSSSSEQME